MYQKNQVIWKNFINLDKSYSGNEQKVRAASPSPKMAINSKLHRGATVQDEFMDFKSKNLAKEAPSVNKFRVVK